MPIYEYHCPGCDNLFEEWCRRIDDQKSKPCPACGKTASRIMSHTSFALKGDGWYVTEYGSKKGIKESDSGSAEDTKEPVSADTAAPATPSASPAANQATTP